MKEIIPIDELISLSGRAAIVTGGAKGIGWAIAYRLAEAGARVLIADIDGRVAEKTADSFRERGWTAEATYADVSDESSVKRMIASCVTLFGGVDILVNNAGIYPNMPLETMTSDDFERVIDVNLKSVFMATKAAVENMKEQGGGKIINITSIDALHPSVPGLAHYDASKHGVWGFTKSIAVELAPFNIYVNAIAPGGIQTPGVASLQQKGFADKRAVEQFLEKIPMRRMGEPDEIGTVALFLASGLSSYMTGEQIVVDGGRLLS